MKTMNQNNTITRRNALVRAGAAAAAIGGVMASHATAQTATPPGDPAPAKGRLRQSVCQWCFDKMSVEDLAVNAKRLGLVGIDLLTPAEFPILKKHDLICTMTRSHGIGKGLNRKENWDECLAQIRTAIDATAEAGYPNVICFSGNREGISNEEGLANCAEALKKIVGHAEEKKVTISMELLNSKRNHADYMCDRTAWGVELCKKVGSDRFKLLYDIYHMQIDEGDVIDTIKENKDYIAHYHTAGVPGRNELDDTQELFYPAIARAIAETGFAGIFAHEFIPKRDPMTSLAEAIKVCTV